MLYISKIKQVELLIRQETKNILKLDLFEECLIREHLQKYQFGNRMLLPPLGLKEQKKQSSHWVATQGPCRKQAEEIQTLTSLSSFILIILLVLPID